MLPHLLLPFKSGPKNTNFPGFGNGHFRTPGAAFDFRGVGGTRRAPGNSERPHGPRISLASSIPHANSAAEIFRGPQVSGITKQWVVS